MKPWRNSLFWVWLTTIYLVLFVALVTSGFGLQIAMLMFSLSPILIVWMVIRVLKDDFKSKKTFSEYFYEDMDLKKIK